jgi:hypothetical protein
VDLNLNLSRPKPEGDLNLMKNHKKNLYTGTKGKKPATQHNHFIIISRAKKLTRSSSPYQGLEPHSLLLSLWWLGAMVVVVTVHAAYLFVDKH